MHSQTGNRWATALWLLFFVACAILLKKTHLSAELLRGLVSALPAVVLTAGLLLAVCRLPGIPARWRIIAVSWGCIVAPLMASWFNLYAQYKVENLAQDSGFFNAGHSANLGFLASAVISAPLVEEAGKGLCVAVLLFSAARPVTGVWAGAVLACYSALGFGMMENGISFNISSGEGSIFTGWWNPRLAYPLMHALYTLPLGAAIGGAALLGSLSQRIALVAAGWLVSLALHASWNWFFIFHEPTGSDWSWAAFGAIPVLALALLGIRHLERKSLMRHGLAAKGWHDPRLTRLAELDRLDAHLPPTPEEVEEKERLAAAPP
jgi:RsiW-degrading membrane proteinase PrsW (M82 family)